VAYAQNVVPLIVPRNGDDRIAMYDVVLISFGVLISLVVFRRRFDAIVFTNRFSAHWTVEVPVGMGQISHQTLTVKHMSAWIAYAHARGRQIQ
jgi:hypothetical protein